jgi:hypothetical protein
MTERRTFLEWMNESMHANVPTPENKPEARGDLGIVTIPDGVKVPTSGYDHGRPIQGFVSPGTYKMHHDPLRHGQITLLPVDSEGPHVYDQKIYQISPSVMRDLQRLQQQQGGDAAGIEAA